MTNKMFIAACAAFILSAAIIFVSILPGTISNNAEPVSGSIEASDESVSYIVKAYGDKIGIYISGESEPIKTIGIDPSALPDEALQLLKNGITVDSRSELLLLIEDYIS